MTSSSSAQAYQPILFCASHINNEERLDLFGRMLKSVAAQTHPTPFWLSISTSNGLKAGVDNLLNQHKLTLSPNNRIFMQEQRYQQFEHYQYLVHQYSTDEKVDERTRRNSWIAFIDDDDQIAPKRMESFHSLLSKVTRLNPPYVVITSPRFIPVHGPGQKELSDKGYIKSSCRGEYFIQCVYFPALSYFFARTASSVWHDPLCDQHLVKYLRPLSSTHAVYAENDQTNEYIYWRRPSDQAHIFVDETDGKENHTLAGRKIRWLISSYCSDERQLDYGAEFNPREFIQWMKVQIDWYPDLIGIDSLDVSDKEVFDIVSRLVKEEGIQHIFAVPSYRDWLKTLEN